MVNLRALPKISLHDHLDGGLRPQTIVELAAEIGHKLPADNAKDLAAWFHESANSGSLVRYLETFDQTLAVMQTREGLVRVAREFVQDLHEDGVIYGEIRWAPEQHLQQGLTLDEVVEAVQDGLEQGIDDVAEVGSDIRTGQLITAMRHNDRALEIAELAVRHRFNGVVGFDIAGPEAGFPPSNHKAAFDYLAEQMFPATVHAGEADGVDSIADALVSGRAIRLGHGVRLAEDIDIRFDDEGMPVAALREVAEWIHFRHIPLELCPQSNLQTGAVEAWGPELDTHPFDLLYSLGFAVTVSPDNRLMSNTSITKELELLSKTFGYDLDDLEQFQITAAEATFQGLEDREELIERVRKGFEKARR